MISFAAVRQYGMLYVSTLKSDIERKEASVHLSLWRQLRKELVKAAREYNYPKRWELEYEIRKMIAST